MSRSGDRICLLILPPLLDIQQCSDHCLLTFNTSSNQKSMPYQVGICHPVFKRTDSHPCTTIVTTYVTAAQHNISLPSMHLGSSMHEDAVEHWRNFALNGMANSSYADWHSYTSHLLLALLNQFAWRWFSIHMHTHTLFSLKDVNQSINLSTRNKSSWRSNRMMHSDLDFTYWGSQSNKADASAEATTSQDRALECLR